MSTFSTEGHAERHLIAEGYRWVGDDATGHWQSRDGSRLAIIRWSGQGYQVTIGEPPRCNCDENYCACLSGICRCIAD